MNAEQTIREALKTIMPEGEANACRIWKGYDVATGCTGWHITKFGHFADFYGENLADVLFTIDDTAAKWTAAERMEP